MAAVAAARMTNIDRYQCMFTWIRGIGIPRQFIPSQWIINAVEDKLLTSDCEWQSCVYYLVLSYEYHELKNESKARDLLGECEDIISSAECVLSSPLLNRNVDAVRFVLHSTWLHLISKVISYEVYGDYTQEMMLYNKMTRQQKAGVQAIHAACLMEYGQYQISLEILRVTTQNSKNEGHWHFLIGKALQYQRLTLSGRNTRPGEEELHSLELAHSLDGNTPSHFVGLAFSLYESVKAIQGPSEFRDKATELYKSALENWPHSPYVNLMCASGLLYYAYPVRETSVVDQIICKMLKIASKSFHVHLVAGIFFKWPNKNRAAADDHLNLASERFRYLVHSIRKGKVKNYRMALIQAMVDLPKLNLNENSSELEYSSGDEEN